MAEPVRRNSPLKNRISSPTKNRGGATIPDIDHYAPFLLNAVSNAWLRKTAALYRERFELGIVEWRIIAMLNIEPQITANRVCEVIRLDKSAASKSLKILLDRNLVNFEASPTDPRKRRWFLSPTGLEIHERILTIALQCEELLVKDISAQDLETFLRVMRKMLENIDG